MSKSARVILGLLSISLAVVLAVVLKPKQAIGPTNQQTYTNPEAPTPATATLFFAGDIMLSRNVAAQIYKADDPTLPFKNIKDVTASADISFANLESPFKNTGDHSIEGSLVFNADPKSIAGLTSAGFDILSTANNHALDQGKVGIDYTLNLLKQNNIIPVGTTDANFDLSRFVLEKNKINFGFLSYSYTALNDGGKTSSPYVANFNDLAQLKQDILALKGHYADVVIVNMHAGVEYTRKPTQQQIDFAHAAIDAGADMVIGEHPHWIQTIEIYKDHPIFYSLGNFVFDQMWSQDTKEGLTAMVTYENQEINKIELKPVIIENYCCPRWANDEEAKTILSKINLTSNTLLPHN